MVNLLEGGFRDIVLNKLKNKFDLIVVTARNDMETEIAKEKLTSE